MIRCREGGEKGARRFPFGDTRAKQSSSRWMHFLPRLNLSAGAGTNLSVSFEISTRVGSRWKRVMLVLCRVGLFDSSDRINNFTPPFDKFISPEPASWRLYDIYIYIFDFNLNGDLIARST